uniref:Uncharacterized protein n=1 Tax=Anguilla anguilla TaxID=7936 RepID=A0A0E9UAU6_ANGAN
MVSRSKPLGLQQML